MGRSQRAAICGVSWNNQERTAVVTDRVFSTMVITLVLVCVSLATPAEVIRGKNKVFAAPAKNIRVVIQNTGHRPLAR
jgi:hypothetical protein